MCLNPNNMVKANTKHCRETRTGNVMRLGIRFRLDEWPATAQVIYMD